MRFLIDAQLPPDLAKFLTSLGHEAKHVADCGLLTASDQEIWDYAVRRNAVILTKDHDFVEKRNLFDGPQIVWLRMGNSRKAELRRALKSLLPDIIATLENGDGIVEGRSR